MPCSESANLRRFFNRPFGDNVGTPALARIVASRRRTAAGELPDLRGKFDEETLERDGIMASGYSASTVVRLQIAATHSAPGFLAVRMPRKQPPSNRRRGAWRRSGTPPRINQSSHTEGRV